MRAAVGQVGNLPEPGAGCQPARRISSCPTWFVVLAAAITVGCGASSHERAYEYMPDMARDPAYKAYAPNPVTRDGLTLQLPVAGTVPRGYAPFRYGPGEQEAARAGRELANPLRATPQVMQEGWELYRTYCLVCHGKSGKGDGPVAEKIPHPPSYTSDRVMQFPPGRLFHVITMGAGKMRPYAAQLSAAERWKVVTYVRTALQQLADQPATGQQGGKP
ncbi:MAG: cytochrome c [Acidobacteriia bacterium]|nr:cytochrome c [Terriglobia bacterium]